MKPSSLDNRNFAAGVCERGQVLVIGLIVSLALVMAAVTVANVGMMVAEKIHAQDTVDAAAYSAAVVEARYMNLSAYINRAMVANYDSMAFNTALWATFDADDHGVAALTDVLYKLSEVLTLFVVTVPIAQAIDSLADVTAAVHSPLHEVNDLLDDAFAQDGEDLNQYLEVYNVYALTMYQGLLYASLQADRFRVVREVASKMDSELVTTTTLGLGGETVSYDQMSEAVDWMIRDTNARSGVFNNFNRAFNDMAGVDESADDHPRLLAAVAEASLDKFVAGRDRAGDPDLLRQFNTGNILGGLGLDELTGPVLEVPCIPPCVAGCSLGCSGDILDGPSAVADCIDECPSDCEKSCDVKLEFRLGAQMRDNQENLAAQTHVPFLSRRRMREVNYFGIQFLNESDNPLYSPIKSQINGIGIPGNSGHTSGDTENDVANSANATFSITGGIDFDRASECEDTGTGCQLSLSTPANGYNSLNMTASTTMLPIPLPGAPIFIDDHWDGTYDAKPVASHQVYDPVSGKIDPPQYLAFVGAEGLEEGVPKYDWIVDLDNVGIPQYHYPAANAQQRPANSTIGGAIVGPSVAVVGVKRARDINGLRGLGIGLEAPNDYPITAISRAQVYYLRNPKRPDEAPSMFNPHWVARLAPIDADDTPALLREVIPFISGLGVPIEPTH